MPRLQKVQHCHGNFEESAPALTLDGRLLAIVDEYGKLFLLDHHMVILATFTTQGSDKCIVTTNHIVTKGSIVSLKETLLCC